MSTGIDGPHAIVAAATASSTTVVMLPVKFANNEIPDANPCTYWTLEMCHVKTQIEKKSRYWF